MSWRRLVWVWIAILGLGFAAGCSDDDKGTEPTTVVQFDEVQKAFDAWLSSGNPPTISSADVFAEINDTNPENRPYVLSVRSTEHYEIGHVPGAANIPWRTIAVASNLATLPTDKKIVVYCYTGHTGQLSTTLLNAMGFNAVNMKHGMMAWSKDAAVRVASPFSDPPQDYPTETTVNTLTTIYDFPDLNVTTSDDPAVIVREAANAYASTAVATISADALFENINDGNSENDYFIVSVRSSGVYEIGHIPGAYNIPWREIAKTENLEKLPPDKPILCYCYTGHTGQVATAVLGTLGYDAVNLKFGMCGWTTDQDVRATTPFREEDYADYPTEP